MPDENQKQKGLFRASPKLTFLLGLFIGIAILSTAGFLVTLTILLGRGGSGSDNTNSAVLSANTNKNTNTSQVAQVDLSKLSKVTDLDHIRGNKEAPLTIVVFADFQCPYCGRFHNSMKQLLSEYEGKVRWVYRHFPLSSIHPQAQSAAEASECAAEQDKFWEYVDKLLENQSSLGENYYPQLAEELGLGITQFQDCLNTNKFQDLVSSQYTEATLVGGQGTPYSILIDQDGNKETINGAVPYEDYTSSQGETLPGLKSIIESKL